MLCSDGTHIHSWYVVVCFARPLLTSQGSVLWCWTAGPGVSDYLAVVNYIRDG